MLPWIYLLISVFGLYPVRVYACKDFQEVLCSAPECNITGTSATLNDGRKLSCSTSHISYKVPPVDPDTEPAPFPEDAKVNCYQVFSTYIRTFKAALEVSWASRERLITNGKVKGYILNFISKTQKMPLRYNVTLEFDGEARTEGTRVPECVKFIDMCYGHSNGLLKPGSEMEVRIDPIPRAKRGEVSNKWWETYKVPNVSQCRPPDTQTTSQNTATTVYFSEPGSQERPAIVWIILPISVFLPLIVAVLWLIKKKKMSLSQSRSKDGVAETHLLEPSKNILIVANREKEKDCDKAHRLASQIRERSGVEVTCNFENVKSIVHEQESVFWYHKQCSKADSVIFINGARVLRQMLDVSGNQESRLTDEFSSVINSRFRPIADGAENQKTKNIFVDDEPEDVKYVNKVGIKSIQGFLFKKHYERQDGFYQGLFGARKSKSPAELFKRRRYDCRNCLSFTHEQSVYFGQRDEAPGDGVETTTV